uniref:Lissencephaly-1 homolog n=1 Tax=Ditylenchus dipsaci TaxID=166011 RepID=A0A915EIC3_9BILA
MLLKKPAEFACIWPDSAFKHGDVKQAKRRFKLGYNRLLETHGFSHSSEAFRKEANIDENADPNRLAQVAGLLEKKWTLTTRLQQKVLQLEEKVQQMDREAMSGAPSRDKRQPTEWIPRPPERYQLNGHRLPVTRVIFHPMFNSGEFERSLKGHTDSVQDINFNASGKLLVSCSADMSIKIWDFHSNYDCLKTLKGHDHNISSVTFLPSGDFVLSASRDKLIKLWDVANGFCVQNFAGHSDWVRMVRVNASAHTSLRAAMTRQSKYGAWQQNSQKQHWLDMITLWSTETSKESKMNGDMDSSQQQQAILISASRDRSILVWEVVSSSCLFTLQVMTIGDDKTMRIWSIEHKRCIKVLQAHAQFVTSVDFHPKLPYVVTSSVDTTIKVWECR